MAHMLDTNKANFMAFAAAGGAPWHSLGVSVNGEDCFDVDGFAKKAGLNTNIFCAPLTATYNGQSYPIKDKVACLEEFPNGEVIPLCTMGHKTTILQNSAAFEFFRPFVNEGKCALETAGRMDEGRKIWVLASLLALGEAEVRKNDSIKPYLLLSNSHDNSMSVRVGFTPIRVVCWNTLSASHSAEASKLIRIRHSAKVEENVMELQKMINLVSQSFQADLQQYRALAANKNINQNDVRRYVQIVYNLVEDDGSVKEFGDLPKQSREKIREIENRFASKELGNGQGSAWDLYNAVTEQLTYGEGRSKEGRFDSLWFGRGASLNDRALQAALAI